MLEKALKTLSIFKGLENMSVDDFLAEINSKL
jgi:hypothetical protein